MQREYVVYNCAHYSYAQTVRRKRAAPISFTLGVTHVYLALTDPCLRLTRDSKCVRPC